MPPGAGSSTAPVDGAGACAGVVVVAAGAVVAGVVCVARGAGLGVPLRRSVRAVRGRLPARDRPGRPGRRRRGRDRGDAGSRGMPRRLGGGVAVGAVAQEQERSGDRHDGDRNGREQRPAGRVGRRRDHAVEVEVLVEQTLQAGRPGRIGIGVVRDAAALELVQAVRQSPGAARPRPFEPGGKPGRRRQRAEGGRTDSREHPLAVAGDGRAAVGRLEQRPFQERRRSGPTATSASTARSGENPAAATRSASRPNASASRAASAAAGRRSIRQRSTGRPRLGGRTRNQRSPWRPKSSTPQTSLQPIPHQRATASASAASSQPPSTRTIRTCAPRPSGCRARRPGRTGAMQARTGSSGSGRR